MDTQAIYRAAVLKRDEQETMVRAFKTREKAVATALQALSSYLQVQVTQTEMLIRRMILGAR